MKFLIKTVFEFIYKVLSVFNLQPTLAVVLVGTLLYLTGVMNANATVKFIFQIALILSLVYALIETLKNLLGFNKKVKKSKGVEMLAVESGKSNNAQTQQPQQENISVDKPTYFRVKQNPNLIMAEYSNRYELFKVDNGNLIKIRTDYKS